MKNIGCREFDVYNFWNSKAQLYQLQLNDPAGYGLPTKETRLSSIDQVMYTPLVCQDLLEGCQNSHNKIQQRPLDLQLSADEFINHVESDLARKGNLLSCLKEPIDFNHRYSGGRSSGLVDLKLSLSIVDHSRKTEGTVRNWFDEKTHSSTQNVIDLEESAERIYDWCEKFTPSGCASLATYSIGKHESQVSDLFHPNRSSNVKTHQSHLVAESSSDLEQSKYCLERTSSSKDIREHCDHIPFNDISIKRQHFALFQERCLDLNKVQLDDFSCHSNGPTPNYPATASSAFCFSGTIGSIQEGTCPVTSWRKEVTKCLNETSETVQLGDCLNRPFVDLNRKSEDMDIWATNSPTNESSGGTVSIIGPESMSRTSVVNSEDLKSFSGDDRDGNVELKAKGTNGSSYDENHSIATREVSYEKSKVEDAVFACTDQSQNTIHDVHGNKSPASCKSDYSDNDSSSIKTMQSSIISCLNQYSEKQIGSHFADGTSGEDELRTLDGSDWKNEYQNKKEESAEMMDILMQTAAESLIHISLENPASYQESHKKLRSVEIKNERRKQPESSSDSFELIALNLAGSNPDDDCVSSKPFEVNDLETKDFGFKWRRGRRLKDFQKEILPGLASLSRHEICEDMNIIEGALRSREYRKFRAKIAASHGDNWSPPTRNKRSRFNCAARRKIF